jgi:The  BURPS668_1122 family of deaminases
LIRYHCDIDLYTVALEQRLTITNNPNRPVQGLISELGTQPRLIYNATEQLSSRVGPYLIGLLTAGTGAALLRGGRIADAIITNVRRAERLVNRSGPDVDAPDAPGTPNVDAPNTPRTDADAPNPSRIDPPDTDGDGPDAEANDLPNGPASSAANAERLRQQLIRLDPERFAEAARNDIGDIRSRLVFANPDLQGNVAVAYLDIDGLPNTRQLAAHSGTSNPTADLVGDGPGQFTSSTVPNAEGFPIRRSVDSEYKILDNLAAQLGNNTQARGVVNLFTEITPCTSCNGVIDQFRARYPNIRINVRDNGINRIPPRPTVTPPTLNSRRRN